MELLRRVIGCRWWKLLTKKGETWHVSCVIWHDGEPYSFGFDMVSSAPVNAKYPKLARRTPNEYLKLGIFRTKNEKSTLKPKGHKYLET